MSLEAFITNFIAEVPNPQLISPEFLKVLVASSLAVTMGLLVKLALEWDNNRLTWKSAFVQTIFSAGVGYLVFFWLDGHGLLGVRQEVILFVSSLGAAHIVAAINAISKDKSRGVLDEILNRIIARKTETQRIEERKQDIADFKEPEI